MRKNFPQPFDFNAWYASNYDNESVNIADDFFVADPTCKWSLLAAHWLVMNKNGKAIDPIFSVPEVIAASKKEGWHPHECAVVINASFEGWVRWRKDDVPTKIEPPNSLPPVKLPTPDPYAHRPNMPQKPEPSPEKPKGLPEVKLPQEPKAPSKTPWKLIATIVAAVAFGLKFTPVPAFVIGIIDMLVKIIQAIPS
jgi:hypothetical protein